MSSPLAHGSIALITKKIFPNIPLWILLLATQIPDALFFIFKYLGMEVQAITTHYAGIYSLVTWVHSEFDVDNNRNFNRIGY